MALNGRETYRNMEEAESMIHKLKSVGQQLRFWYENTINEPDKFLTVQTFDDVMLLCDGVPAFTSYIFDVIPPEASSMGFTPKRISQDPLEATFSDLRQRGGGTDNITVLSIAYNLRTINCNHLNTFLQILGIEL